MASDEQAKEEAKTRESPQQMMHEYVQRRHMIQKAQMAAVHITDTCQVAAALGSGRQERHVT